MGATLSRVDGADLTEKMTNEQRSEGGWGCSYSLAEGPYIHNSLGIGLACQCLGGGSPLFDFVCSATAGWGLAQAVLTKDTHSSDTHSLCQGLGNCFAEMIPPHAPPATEGAGGQLQESQIDNPLPRTLSAPCWDPQLMSVLLALYF